MRRALRANAPRRLPCVLARARLSCVLRLAVHPVARASHGVCILWRVLHPVACAPCAVCLILRVLHPVWRVHPVVCASYGVCCTPCGVCNLWRVPHMACAASCGMCIIRRVHPVSRVHPVACASHCVVRPWCVYSVACASSGPVPWRLALSSLTRPARRAVCLAHAAGRVAHHPVGCLCRLIESHAGCGAVGGGRQGPRGTSI